MTPPKNGIRCPRCRWVRFKFTAACPRCSDNPPLKFDTSLKDEMFELKAKHFRMGVNGGGNHGNGDLHMHPDAPPARPAPATVTPITRKRAA